MEEDPEQFPWCIWCLRETPPRQSPGGYLAAAGCLQSHISVNRVCEAHKARIIAIHEQGYLYCSWDHPIQEILWKQL